MLSLAGGQAPERLASRDIWCEAVSLSSPPSSRDSAVNSIANASCPLRTTLAQVMTMVYLDAYQKSQWRLIKTEEQISDLYPAQWSALRYLLRANRFSRTPMAQMRETSQITQHLTAGRNGLQTDP